MKLRVLLVDDQVAIRQAIGRILLRDLEIEIVGEMENGRDISAIVQETTPDVILLDVRMPVRNGIEALDDLQRGTERTPPVLILTTFDDEHTVADCLHAGAAGFILKDSAPEDLLRAVHAVALDLGWIDPRVAAPVLNAYRQKPSFATNSARVSSLTSREREVLVAIGTGASNAEIAEMLFISETTVKTHIQKIFAKLQLRDRSAAVILALSLPSGRRNQE